MARECKMRCSLEERAIFQIMQKMKFIFKIIQDPKIFSDSVCQRTGFAQKFATNDGELHNVRHSWWRTFVWQLVRHLWCRISGNVPREQSNLLAWLQRGMFGNNDAEHAEFNASSKIPDEALTAKRVRH